MTTIGTFGTVLNAARTNRAPVRAVDHTQTWSDVRANFLLLLLGHGSPINGDCVTLDHTRFYHDGRWLGLREFLKVELQAPASNYCPHCSGTGYGHLPYIPMPVTCAVCKGTGRTEDSVADARARPGIGDELKPELKSKRLRYW